MTQEESIILKKLTGEIPTREQVSVCRRNTAATVAPASQWEDAHSEQLAKAAGYLQVLESNRINHAHREIVTSKKPAKLIIFFKKIIRKLIKWYVEPVCYQQTDFNNAVTLIIRQLTEQESLAGDEIASLKQKQLEADQSIRSLQEQTANIRMLLQERNVRISSLERQLAVIRSGVAADAEGKDVDYLHYLPMEQVRDYLKEQDGMMISASQSGEDGIIAYIFKVLDRKIPECSYLDLGANHAREISNTYHFYLNGARGVLVEANPDLIGELKHFREEDVVLNCCIGEKDGEKVPLYVLNGDGLSTPDLADAEAAIALNPTLAIDKIVEVETLSVNTILSTYFQKAPDFLNIDIEGGEMDVLNAINFERYRPLVICIETIPYRTHLVVGEKREDIVSLMQQKGYVEYAFTGINSIFLDKTQLKEM